jgi:hypothetical protein
MSPRAAAWAARNDRNRAGRATGTEWKAGISRQHLTYFVQSDQFPPPFAPREQRLMRMAEGRLVVWKLAQHRVVELLQKALKKCLDDREPPRMCRGRGIYAPGFSSSTKNRGGILLVLARTNVRRRGHRARAGIVAPVLSFFGCVRGSSLLFSKERPAVGAWNSSIFGHPPFCQKHLGNRKKKVTQKQKEWRDDLRGKP